MGQGTDGMKESPQEIEHDIEALRHEIDPVLEELDHRRQAVTAAVSRLRRRAPALVKGAAVLVGLVVTVRAVRGFRARRARRHAARRADRWRNA